MRKVGLVNVLLLVLFVLCFDAVMYFFLPSSYTYRFVDYRKSPPPDLGQGTTGIAGYPRGYFVRHSERGFDIGKNKSGRHWVDGTTYPIWSNSLGCFDREHAEPDRYIYFAGDSFTWGYTPFEQKFGTIVERESGTPILKCGVTHTGQRHQFEKMLEVVSRVEKPPAAIFLFYVWNDVANDYAHPHSTVVDGWLVDSAFLEEEDKVVRLLPRELSESVRNKVEKLRMIQEASRGSWSVTKQALKRYSLSTSMLVYLKDGFVSFFADSVGLFNDVQGDPTGPKARAFYKLSQRKGGAYWYFGNPVMTRNLAALLGFKEYSTKNGIDLVVVMIPPKKRMTDSRLYDELRIFLTDSQIGFLDLSIPFERLGLEESDLYWARNAHLSPDGNRVVAEILLDSFPDIFRPGEAALQ